MSPIKIKRNPLEILSHKILDLMRRVSIFKRLMFSFLLVIILPNLIIGYVSFDKSSRELDSITSDSLNQFIGSINNAITERLKKYEDLSYSIYMDSDLNNLLKQDGYLYRIKNQNPSEFEKHKNIKAQISELLYRKSSSPDFITNIEILSDFDEYTQINYNGEVLGGKLRDPISFRNSQYYKSALESKGYPIWVDASKKSDLFERQYSGEKMNGTVMLLRTIQDLDGGNPLGVLIINVSIKAFLDLYEGGNSIRNGNLLLVGGEGSIISLNENVKGPVANKEISSKVLSMKKGTIIEEINGVQCLVVFQNVENTGWEVVSIIPRKVLLSSSYAVRDIVFRITVLCMLFAAFLSYFVTLSISKPLGNLKKSMSMVNEKNIEVKYTDQINDEVGILGKKFNSMIDRIKNLINTVYEVKLTQKGEELRRKEAELDALQMQINPHFLYNTLDIIRWEVAMQENGDGKASKMIKAFADLLRLGTKKNTKLVKFEEELDHIKAYIKVMEFKCMEDFKVTWDIGEDTANCKITKLTLQPIIENSIVHGFTGMTGEKMIHIRAFKTLVDLVIEIRDNGKGIEQDRLKSLLEEIDSDGEGLGSIGLKNVNERIKLYFGANNYGLNIISRSGQGTSVYVRIPMLKDLECDNKDKS